MQKIEVIKETSLHLCILFRQAIAGQLAKSMYYFRKTVRAVFDVAVM